MKIEIDAYGIKSIFDKRTGLPVAQAAAMHDSLLTLTMKKPGNAIPFTCDLYNATLEKCEVGGTSDTPVLSLVHRMDNGLRVTTTAKLLPDGQSEWQMAIENPTEFEVAEFLFPVVTGIALGGDPTDDWLFMPRYWGQVMKNPGAEGRILNNGESTPMRWTAMWDDKQGIYLGIEDPRFEDYWFLYGGDTSGNAVLAARQRTLVKPNSTWKSGVFRLALTGGDWHECADIYRAYVAHALKPNDVHPYIKWLVDSWCVMPSNDGTAIGWDMIFPDDDMLMAAWRQTLDGPDVSYCGVYTYPALAWGSTREYSQKLAVRRALGGMFIDYLDTHLWCAGDSYRPRIATFPKSRLPADAPKPDGDWYLKAAAYSYDGTCGSFSENSPLDEADSMAMGSREWRDWLSDWTLRDINFGTDGRYYDQFNMIYDNGRLYPDFDTYGCWVPATLDFISKIRKTAREKNPYFTTSGEVCSDVYGQFLDLHMTSGVWNRLDFFLYCLPHQLTIDGNSNVGLVGLERMPFIWQVGSKVDFWPYNPELIARFHHFMALRRAVKSLLYDATFRDTVGLTVRDASGKVLLPEYVQDTWQNAPFKGTIGRWFLVDQDGQRGAIVNLINAPAQKGATCTINTKEFGPVAAALAVTFEGAWVPVAGKQEGDTFTFPVPESECSSVILSGKLAPLVEWNIEPAAAPGVTRKLTLKLTNANAEPVSGTARLRLPHGWNVPAEMKFGPIPGGQSQTLTITLTVPRNVKKGRTDIWCDIVTPTGKFSAYSLLVVNDPVIADFRGNPGSYHVWLKNLTSGQLTGKLSVAGRDGLKVSAPAEFTLPPEAEVKVPVEVIGRDKLQEISEMSATVKTGRQTIDVVRAVMPTVPNGAFEIDGAGDRKPDWWMCRKVNDRVSYERLHLAENSHSGKYCLQLDPPQKDEKFIRAYPVNGAFKPGARYRASVWIKCDSAKGVYAQVAGQVLGSGRTGSEWKQFTVEFVQGKEPNAYVGVHNESTAPAFFDDFKIEEIN